jgi:hypothetical protein
MAVAIAEGVSVTHPTHWRRITVEVSNTERISSSSWLGSAAHARAIAALLAIGFGAWLLLAWRGYRTQYPQLGQSFHVGTTHSVELTLVREDVENLACAAGFDIEGLRCGYDRRQRSLESIPRTDPKLLMPYFTVKRELLLGAGLFSSKALAGSLPSSRFSVVCAYHVVGVTKSAELRWSKTGKFDPLKETVSVGTLTNCVVPE